MLFYKFTLTDEAKIEEKPHSVIAITETNEIDIYHAIVIPTAAYFPEPAFLTDPFKDQVFRIKVRLFS